MTQLIKQLAIELIETATRIENFNSEKKLIYIDGFSVSFKHNKIDIIAHQLKKANLNNYSLIKTNNGLTINFLQKD